MRLIDADALLERWKIQHEHGSCNGCPRSRGREGCVTEEIYLDDFCDSIDEMETVDTVPKEKFEQLQKAYYCVYDEYTSLLEKIRREDREF